MIRRMARTAVAVVGVLVLGAFPAGAAAGPVVSLESTFATSWNGVPLGETWVRLERLVNSGDTAQTVTGITLGNASEFGPASPSAMSSRRIRAARCRRRSRRRRSAIAPATPG